MNHVKLYFLLGKDNRGKAIFLVILRVYVVHVSY